MPSAELTVLVLLCRTAVAARDEELATWKTWAETIERRAQEELGNGQVND